MILSAGLVCSLHLGALALAGVGGNRNPADLRAFPGEADDLSRVNAAFFTMNGYVSVLFFVFWAADIFFLQTGCL